MTYAFKTVKEFTAYVDGVRHRDGYKDPIAYGIGIAHTNAANEILDAFFPCPNFKANMGTAAIIADELEFRHGTSMTLSNISQAELWTIRSAFSVFDNDGETHPNIDAIKSIRQLSQMPHRQVVITLIADLDDPIVDICDAYLRLHLLSHRLVKPNEMNLDGIFGKLRNVAWTSEGPIDIAELPARQAEAQLKGRYLAVHSMDRFPRMLDYVVPSGVRIANAANVRLGAYLSEGTVVMHAGSCNFNAGTLGTSMIEGRISQGVVVGANSDIGGGASTMGTLSGGGKEKIRIGERTLLGANAGIGISLGDDCIVEAGCYITAGMKLMYTPKDAVRPIETKAGELSGKNALLFRRNSLSGAVEAVHNTKAVVLNDALHAT